MKPDVSPQLASDTPGESMRDMSAIDTDLVSFRAAPDARCDRTLTPNEVDGVKEYELVASVIRWNILSHERVNAYAFNRQVPGVVIQLQEWLEREAYTYPAMLMDGGLRQVAAALPHPAPHDQ